MLKSFEECREFAQEVVEYYPNVLPALDVISEAKSIAQGWLDITKIGQSLQGHSIQLMSQSKGKQNAFLYGFPDPGEAVGGASILCLMKALKEEHSFFKNLKFDWNFIPCLNLDDQPDSGRTLGKVMKTQGQAVDWLVLNPRPETSALLETAHLLRPQFTFPLHDEWHCHEEIPCYMPVNQLLPQKICQGLRRILESFDLKVSSDVVHSEMGDGFLYMADVENIQTSTFYEFGKTGTVFICETPEIPHQPDSKVIAAQLATGLFVAANVTH